MRYHKTPIWIRYFWNVHAAPQFLIKFALSLFLSFSLALMASLVRLQTTLYGSNRIGSCITSDWIPSKLLGAFSENSNIYYARRWTVAIWLSSLFSNHGKFNRLEIEDKIGWLAAIDSSLSFSLINYETGCGSSSVHIFSEFAWKRILGTAWRSQLVKRIGSHTAQAPRHLWY